MKKVNAIDARNKERAQSNQTVDNNIYQGIVGHPKMKKISSLFNHDHQKAISDLSSSSNDNDPKDDSENICDIEVEDFISTAPINEYAGDNIDIGVVDEENTKQPVEYVRNNNTDVKVDVVYSLTDNNSKNYNITTISKDKYSNLHVDMWDNNMKATTATINKKSIDKSFKAAKENEKNQNHRHKDIN